MIDHICIEVSSKKRCREVFEEVLGLKPAYSFQIEQDFMERMFKISKSCEAVVYQAGDTKIEVFIRPEMEKSGGRTSHLCLLMLDRSGGGERTGRSAPSQRRTPSLLHQGSRWKPL